MSLTAKPVRFHRVDLALILAVAAIVIRVLWPGVNASFWLDEQMIAMNIRDRDLFQLAGALDHDQSAPLGWLWIERILFVLLGSQDWVLRLPPVLSGVGIVLVAWAYGRRWLGRLGSVALVALAGFSYASMFYTSQLKHYSADILWSFALIALARWVIEKPHSHRRHLCWWGAALAGSWLSNGATFVTPGIGLVLMVMTVWRQPLRTWLRAAVPGAVWLASFAAHYFLSLRAASGSQYLNDFWGPRGYPPADGNVFEKLFWFVKQGPYLLHYTFYLDIGLEPSPLAVAVFAVFSGLFAAGLVITFRRGTALGLLLCAPLITGLLLALLRIVPLFHRLSFWLIPPALIAVAHAVDFRPRRRAALRWIAPGAFLLLLVPFVNSVREVTKPPELDDRAAIAWLSERHRAGDLTLIVSFATRAAQWYDADNRLSPQRMVVSVPAGDGCNPAQLGETVRGHDRVLVYAGLRLNPYMETYRILEARLTAMGTIVERENFGTHGMAYVVKLSDAVSTFSAGEPDCVKLY